MSTVSPPTEGPVPTVLVVEDEPTLRASVVRGLARAMRANVLGVGSVSEARRALETTPPDVMVSDIDLPDGTGLELFAELDARGLRIPVIFVSSYVRHYEDRLPRRQGIETYEKPLPLERLKRIVEDALALARTPPLDSSPFVAGDYLQLAGMGRKSVRIDVGSANNEGTIFVSAGHVVAAVDSHGQGMAAFRRMAFAEGRVSCRGLRQGEDPVPNLDGSCEELLMEAARQNDEALLDDDISHGWSVPPPRFSSKAPGAASFRPSDFATDMNVAAPTNLGDPSRSGSESFDALYDAGVEALLLRRYDEAFSVLTRAKALQPDDSRVNANLARLGTLLERQE